MWWKYGEMEQFYPQRSIKRQVFQKYGKYKANGEEYDWRGQIKIVKRKRSIAKSQREESNSSS